MSKRRVQTTDPLNAFDRDKRMWAIRNAYARGHRPANPETKHELDILKERHQFVRSTDVDPATLSWEDRLAAKYYDSLFKEFAIVNLKHWRTGAVALRWRTEDEVLSGIGHLTCASMRCPHHEPSPAVLSRLKADEAALVDPESSTPLVETRLSETEMNFGYVEEGVKKTALVKVVLCPECSHKLKKGKEKARVEREKAAVVPRTLPSHVDRHGREDEEEEARRRDRRSSRRRDDDLRSERRDEKRRHRRSDSDEKRRHGHGSPEPDDRRIVAGDSDGEEDYTPALPPDLAPRRSSPDAFRRRSASPPRRR
ncbi:hypothetical protein JCM10212_003312 [Sporobolomyces blumeae]